MSIDVDGQQIVGNMVFIDRVSSYVRVFRNDLLSERFDTWSEVDINMIFVHYIMGLVVSVFDQLPPEKQIHFIQGLAELEISTQEALRALHVVPPGGRGGLARAVEAAEQAGRHDGGGIRKTTSVSRRSAELGAL